MSTSDSLDDVQTVIEQLEAAGFAVDAVHIEGGEIQFEVSASMTDVDPSGIGGGGVKNGGSG